MMPRPKGCKVVATEIGLHGEVLRLFVRDDSADGVLARISHPGFASFPETRTEREYSALLSVCTFNATYEIPLSNLTTTFPKLQVFPNGDPLVVASRCRRFNDDTYELNATVHDTEGGVLRQFLLGDGIEHVQIDRDGNIWVGYFDEGVYGNFGWGHPNGPVGAAGLTCFNDRGEKLWGFQPPRGFDAISDCYALNVAKDGAWAYYYTGFPFVRIDSEWNVRAWRTNTSGGREFAVHGKHILHYGGYGEHKTDCKLLRLDQETTQLVSQVALLLPTDVDLSRSVVIGRDNKLHVLFDDSWYVFSVESII